MPTLSRSIAGLLMFGGVTACLISVAALRLVLLRWRNLLKEAGGQRIAHVVWHRFDSFTLAFWCTAYVLGGLAILLGVLALDR